MCNDYGFCRQIQRAVISIPSNIAEGNQRWSCKEASQFYSYSNGSVAEVITQLPIAKEINYIDDKTFSELEGKTETIMRC